MKENIIDCKSDSEFSNDCYTAVIQVSKLLVREMNIQENQIFINHYILPEEYHHYTLTVKIETQENILVDPTFSQFARETGNQFNIAPKDEISEFVVVQPANNYIFQRYKKSQSPVDTDVI